MGEIDLIEWIYILQLVVFPLAILEFPNLKYPKWIAFGVVFSVLLVYILIFWPVWNETFWIRGLIYQVILLGAIWCIIDGGIKEKVIAYLSYGVLTLLSDAATAQFAARFLGWTTDMMLAVTDHPLRMLGTAIYPIFHMTFFTIFMSYYNRIEKPVRRRIIFAMLLMLLSHCMFAIALSKQSDLLAENVLVYACVCIFLGVVVQYYMYETINTSVASVKNRLELEHLKEKQRLDLKYIQMAQDSAAEMSAFRHDFKNQLQVAYALLEEDPEQAAAFLKELEGKMEVIPEAQERE